MPLDLTTAGRRGGRLGPAPHGLDGNRAAGAEKNDIKPWVVATWCVPPDADGEYVWRMEDVIQTYMLPYDAKRPVVCFDEASRQLFGEVRPRRLPRPRQGKKPGKRAQVDYEYER